MSEDLELMDMIYLIGEENLINILKEYVEESESFELNNFEEIIKKAEIMNDGKQIKFKLHEVDIILNSEDFSYYDAEPSMPTIYL